MNDYDLFARCQTMIKRDGYAENDIAKKYVRLAMRHLKQSKNHQWLGDELERMDWKTKYRAIPGSITQLTGVIDNQSLQSAYNSQYQGQLSPLQRGFGIFR